MAKSPSSETTSPTQETIDNCKKVLCLEKVANQSITDAKCIDYERGKKDKQYKICCLVKAKETNCEYWNLDFHVGVGAIKEASLIDDMIKGLEEKNTTLLNLYKETVKSIKDVKTKLDAACDEACKLERCIEEEKTCNKDLYNSLNKIDGIWETVNGIKDHADRCCKSIGETFNKSVDIAGIITFTNISSLSAFGKNLKDLMAEFRSDIDKNVTSSKTEVEKSQKELTESINSLTVTKYEKCDAISDTVAACHILDFVCNPDCENCERDLECLCCDVPTYPGGGDKDPCEDPCAPGSKDTGGKGDNKAWEIN